MAFKSKDLILYNTIGIRKWAYSSTTDNIADMQKTNYFNDASDKLKEDDVIEAIGADRYGILLVNSVSAGAVDTDNALTTSGTADTD